MASSLQIGLAIVSGVVLAGFVAYNAWTVRRSEPRQARPEPPPSDPVLGDAPGGDVWADRPGGPGKRLDTLADDPRARIDPTLHVSATGGQQHGASAIPAPDRHARLDALIDVIVPIALDGKRVSGDALIAALPATRRVGTKPFAVEGRNDVTGQWEFPVAGQRYRAVQAGVQLANRAGPLNEIGYSEFVGKTQAYADAIGGAPEFPDMLEQVARARELDQFASSHDAQLSFTLRPRGTVWSPGFVQQQAARIGFVPGVLPGRLVLPGSESGVPALLDLSFDQQAALADDPVRAAIYDVTLCLDVPQVPRESKPYARLTETAFALAQALGGAITDDVGQLLQPHMIESIGVDLERLYDTLEARDLAAGSPQARRLFS